MSERSGPTASRAFDNPGRNESQARFLFFSGWVITLLYLPSGLMHFLFGNGVYFRDGLLFLHVAGCFYWLWRNRELAAFVRRDWALLVPAFFVAPAFADGGSRVEALTFVKWGVLWMDWVILGRLAGLLPGFTTTVKVLVVVTLTLLVADLGTGWYERSTQSFLIGGDADEQTAFGVQVNLEAHIGDQLRVKGLQRDVFSFANLMGMGSVLGLWLFINAKRPALRLPALAWAVAFATMLIVSGGRSAFFGVFACGLLTVSLLLAPNWTRRNYPRFVLAWLLICLTISFVGVGWLTESVGSSVLSSKGVGSSASAYMRDDNWAGILDAMERVPVVLIFGSSFSGVLDSKVDIFYHWADNQYLWLLYHTSVFGLAALIWFFIATIRGRANGEQNWAFDAVILFLLFVMGEAIARESMTFIGVMPLFVAVGFYQASQNAAPPVDTQRASASGQRRVSNSPVYELTRRVQARMKEKR